MRAARWAQAARGPVVYLSNSPEGLAAPLRELLGKHGLPAGPLLLRDFPGVPGPRHKRQALDALARQTGAAFTLIGDSGEHDPELYAAFVQAWPGRVERVLIRDVVGGERRARLAAAQDRFKAVLEEAAASGRRRRRIWSGEHRPRLRRGPAEAARTAEPAV